MARAYHDPSDQEQVSPNADQRQEPDRPAIDRGMVNHYAAFLHDFFDVPIAQGTGCVPANANQNHIDRKPHPSGIQHGSLLIFQMTAVYRTAGAASPNATEPTNLG